ncbi:MAG: adenylate/guanylate cyclase domain-containing protein [Syntrophomonadaceae bacterium]|nr:adenylate/guanylate cyclase domain-containing protein [Syntrophomonadaceae bacterium]
MKRSTRRKIGIALLAAVVLTGLAASGLLFDADSALSDALYQKPRATQGDVTVIGIDARALEEIGPFHTWTREVLAQVVEALNADAEHKPAVIGIDVLFTGQTEPEADARLVEAAQRHGNVVTASTANFGSELVTDSAGNFYMDNYFVTSYDEPFAALREATVTGHINGMYDADGVLRHNIMYIDLPDGTRVPSFAYQVYSRYQAFYGAQPGAMPQMDARYHWYVPFSSLPGGYSDGISVVDVLKGEVPAGFFAGRIVLIGPYAAGMSDHFITAVDHAQLMYGVEYQANVIDALIAQDFKAEVGDRWQLAALFLLSFACALWLLDRRVLTATITWLVLGGGYVGLALWAYNRGYVLHVLWIPLSVTAIYIVAVAANYIRAALEKRRITNTFQRYVAPEIVAEILKEGTDALELGGKMTDIAVLFVDIRGFTPMSEVLQPPQVVEVLNSYLELTSSCIMNNHGTLDKFIGDATMAFWGAPLPQEDYVFNAVKAALDMVERSKELGEELERRFGRTVAFGVGVHCGKAVVGNIGAEMRMDFTAIGDTVNTAARLEANAPAGQVLISRAVADALEGRIIATSLGDTIKLKGKAEGFEILRLEGLV